MTRLGALQRTRRLIFGGRRLIFRGSVAPTLVAVLLGLLGGTAFAHSLSRYKEVYRSGPLCVKADASLSHSGMYGRTEAP